MRITDKHVMQKIEGGAGSPAFPMAGAAFGAMFKELLPHPGYNPKPFIIHPEVQDLHKVSIQEEIDLALALGK